MKLAAALFILIILPLSAMAAGKSKRLLLEANVLAGWGAAQASDDTSAPSIGSFDLNLSAGINIKKISLGVAYDYRILTQYSDVDPSVGNRRGTLVTPMSIFFRLNFEKIRFGFQMISGGTYELMNTTADGKKVSYINPSGFRFDVIFKKIKKITPLLFYESMAFSEMQLDGVSSAMSGDLNYSSFGAGIKYEF